jgi:hypothetical protein
MVRPEAHAAAQSPARREVGPTADSGVRGPNCPRAVSLDGETIVATRAGYGESTKLAFRRFATFRPTHAPSTRGARRATLVSLALVLAVHLLGPATARSGARDAETLPLVGRVGR